MATFPGSIQYADVSPSGRIPAVAAQMPAGGGLEAIGQGLQNLGQAFEKVQIQKDATELSTMKRLFDESSYDHINKYSQLGNPEERKKEAEAWNKEVEGIQSKSARVNAEFQKYKDLRMPNVGQTFANHELAMQAKENKTAWSINGQKYLEQGNMSDYIAGLHTAQATGMITQAEMDYKIENAFTDSAIEIANVDIREGRINTAIKSLSELKDLSGDQLEKRDKLSRLAKQIQDGNDDVFGKQILGEMLQNNNLSPLDKQQKALDMKNRILDPNNGLSLEQSRVLLTNIDKWEKGGDRINDSLLYTSLSRKVTQLKRGIGQASQVRQSILESYLSLDDRHFESLNKYLDETVEGWNADILRRLEKEAMPHLAPRLSMLERFMELAATPGISLQEKAKYDSLIERLQEPAKIDANRLALYLDQARKWIGTNPDATNFYENGRRILSAFEKYTDEQINQMEKNLEELGTKPVIALPETTKEPSPFADYPDAYKEGNDWYVMRDGKRYRVQP